MLYGFATTADGNVGYAEIGQKWAEAYVAQYVGNPSADSPLRSAGAAVLSSELYAESVLTSPKTVVYNMRYTCDAANLAGFERWFTGWAGPLDASRYSEYTGWGYLNYEEAGVFDFWLKETIAGSDDITAENIARNLPFVDWREFDTEWGAEGWDVLSGSC